MPKLVSAAVPGGETITFATDGVLDLPNRASAVVATGAHVARGDTAKQINAPGTGRYRTGTAIEAAGNGATIRVRLDGASTAA